MALNMTNVTFERRARETGGSALMLWAVARFAGSNILFASDPGAGAPGFTLPPASQARRKPLTTRGLRRKPSIAPRYEALAASRAKRLKRLKSNFLNLRRALWSWDLEFPTEQPKMPAISSWL